jgi:uncharacterized protein
MKNWLEFLTVEQWRRIDAEYKTSELPSWRAAAVLVTCALALTLPRYFGRGSFIEGLPVAVSFFRQLPYPDLYPRLYWAGFKLINYGILPMLCIVLVLRGRVQDYGLRLVREPRVWLLYAAMALLVVPMAYAASFTPAFSNTYPKYAAAGNSWAEFLMWESAYGFQFLLLEFFFRGFMIFSLARYIGSLALFVMIVPYAMIHLGKPMAEALGSIVTGVALGTVALRTGSIYGGVAVHCVVAWSMDVFALLQKGQLGNLFGS